MGVMEMAKRAAERAAYKELKIENERLRAENIKVSVHCAALIQTLRDLGEPDDEIAAIARRQS